MNKYTLKNNYVVTPKGLVKTDTISIIEKAKETGSITLKEIALLQKRKNAGENFDESVFWDSEITLTDSKQGYEWLMSLWKTPTGKERENNPFGWREQHVLENFGCIEFRGLRDISKWKQHSFYLPIWVVVSKPIKEEDGDKLRRFNFEYNMNHGKIEITG